MKKIYKIIIIGAGPIGLYLANLCEERKLDYLLLESSATVGGQITNLYPEKEIVDIPTIKSIKAKDYVTSLLVKINPIRIKVNETVIEVLQNNNVCEIKTKNNVYYCEYTAIVTGLGFTKPRTMELENEDKCKNILYSLKDYKFLANKKVAILGGGDSALDWAKTLSSISNDIYLIHRRNEFRGDESTINGCKNLTVLKPYVPIKIESEKEVATSLIIENIETKKHITIPLDYIFVNFGNIPTNNRFNLKYEGNFIKVDNNLLTDRNIFAIGDVASYKNKKRRIAPGREEAEKIINLII